VNIVIASERSDRGNLSKHPISEIPTLTEPVPSGSCLCRAKLLEICEGSARNDVRKLPLT